MANILVVDDYSVTQRVITFILQRSGHQIMTASNGQEALTLLAHTVVDLAIVDMAMPVMDGLTLLKLLRADPLYKDIPIVMLTASGDDQHRLEATKVGADAFLTKPASSQELTETVNGLLANRVV
ncbi:MAG: response regulator [Caldilineaceae bacterium]|nr:response regulator [Caldilineaceae bacterium]MBP8107065.1 response regulator [Caldilineaceae bacterium]MBP8121103.1 response regulator [Caldilineaceae bacterium]MBP9070780.1 response regulator [Caldilineaceae bacterium]